MKKIVIFLVILIITCTISISGCETKTANQTWGEKKIDLSLIEMANNTTSDYYAYKGTQYYYIEGYLLNKNPYDALEVKVKATFYDSQGNIFAVNDTPYMEPKNLPGNGNSYIYFEIADPEKKIKTYNVEILSAKALYGY